MKIKLTRPLIVFDTESTGLSITEDRIIQLAGTKIFPDGNMEKLNEYINPQRPISPEAFKVHKIFDDMVKNELTFEDKRDYYYNFFKGCDLAGFNILNFDVPLLSEEFYRVGYIFPDDDTRFIDAKVIFHVKEPRDLEGALKFYCEKSDSEIINYSELHNASVDVNATVEVLEAMINRYDDLNDVEKLHRFSLKDKPLVDFAGKLTLDKDGDVVFTFGKNEGQKVKNCGSYVNWMKTAGFARDTIRKMEAVFKK